MIVHPDSHLDHSLTTAQLAWLLQQLRGRQTDGVLIETIELPPDLGTVPCGLHGPAMGDAPVSASEAALEPRQGRNWPSRLCDRPPRQTRLLTVVAGPHDGHPLVLFTAYGGPAAPQEPGDPGCATPEESARFWADHALSR